MRKSGLHDLVEGDGKVADAFAGGVVNGVGYGGGGSGDADFADASRAKRVEFVVRDVEGGDVDLVDVGVDGDVVLGEVFVDRAAVGGVDEGLFVEGHADAPDDAADELVGAGFGVDEGADVVGADHAADLHHVSVGVDCDFGEDGAPGVCGKGIVVLCKLGGGGGFYRCVAVAGDEVCDGLGFFWVGFETELAIFGLDVFGSSSAERGLCVGYGELG